MKTQDCAQLFDPHRSKAEDVSMAYTANYIRALTPRENNQAVSERGRVDADRPLFSTSPTSCRFQENIGRKTTQRNKKFKKPRIYSIYQY